MAEPSSEGKTLLSTSRPLLLRVCGKDAREGGNSEGQDTEVPRSAFQCPQTGLPREEGHPRPFQIKQVHPVRPFQDVHYPSGPDTSSPRGLRSLYRSIRRLLARPGRKEFSSVPRVCHRSPSIYLQGNAVWPQHRSESIHEAGKHSCKGTTSEKGQPSSLSGRLAYLGSDPSGMRFVSPHHSRSPHLPGLSRQLQEVPSSSSPALPVARSRLGSVFPQVVAPKGEEKRDCETDETVPSSDESFQAAAREGPRLSSVCLNNQPDPESKIKGPGPDLEVPCLPAAQGHSPPGPSSIHFHPSALVESLGFRPLSFPPLLPPHQ